MKKILMMIAAVAAACAFGGVYDDCVNTIKLAVTNGGCYYFDYHRFLLVPPEDGTFLFIR